MSNDHDSKIGVSELKALLNQLNSSSGIEDQVIENLEHLVSGLRACKNVIIDQGSTTKSKSDAWSNVASVVEIFANSSKKEKPRDPLGNYGVIELIIEFMKLNDVQSQPSVDFQCLRALANICISSDTNRQRILDSGGVETLLTCIRKQSNLDTIKGACATLLNVGMNYDNANVEIVKSDGLIVITRLLEPNTILGHYETHLARPVVYFATRLVINLVGTDEGKQKIADKEIIASLVHLLSYSSSKSATDDDVDLLENVLEILEIASLDNDEVQQILVQDGFFPGLLDFLEFSRNYQEISQLFHNIHKHGIQPDTRTYTIIIQTCVLQGDMSMALEYYEKMKALGIEPNDITYLVLIQGFSKQNDLLNVSKMYNMMLKTIKMRPAYKMLNTMVDLYMRNEEIGKAEETFKIMKNLKLQPDISLYNIIIHNSTLKLDMKTANSFFQEIIKSGFKPDIYTYNIMINGYINSGDQKSAWRMYYHMREQGIEPNEHVGSSLLQLHYEAQDYQGTEQLFNKFFHNITLSRTGNQVEESRTGNQEEESRTGNQEEELIFGQRLKPSINSLTIMWKNKLASAHDIESVNEIYKEFLQVIDKSSKGKDRLLPDSNVFNIFISKFAQGFGDLKRAEEVCKDMTSRGIRSDVATFTILIDGYAMLGQIEKAEETFRTLKSTLLIKPNAYSYTSLIKAWVWVRREDKVKEVYEEMIKEGIKPHRATLRALMKEIIGIPSAQDEISLMPKTPRHILDTLLWSDRLDKAHDVTYAHEIFKNFLRQTDNLVYLGRKPKLNPYSFTIFMRSFALQHGNMSLSLKVFEEMLQRNISPNNVSYGILIEGYARLNQPENAEKIFLEMKNRNIKPTIKNYNSLIRAWVKAGKREKFKEVYQQMIKEGIAPNEQTISIIKMLY